jgi:uncharacterized membrane protein
VVSFATLGWMVAAYLAVPVGASLWRIGTVTWAVVTMVMLLASILLVGSLVRNPAFPTLSAPVSEPGVARGVYAITRHPMMWSVGIWGFAHVAVFPGRQKPDVCRGDDRASLVGAKLQDAKKE